MATQQNRLISPDEYLQSERKAEFKSEYVAGEIFAMAGGSRAHNRLVKNLSDFLTNRKLGAQSCLAFTSDMKVYLRDDCVYCYPDLTVCCGAPAFRDAFEDVLMNPTAVFEVLSPSTMDYDLGDKSFYYRRNPSMRHVALVWLDRVRVAHWSRAEGERWSYREYSDFERQIEFPELGLSVPVREIYLDVLDLAGPKAG